MSSDRGSVRMDGFSRKKKLRYGAEFELDSSEHPSPVPSPNLEHRPEWADSDKTIWSLLKVVSGNRLRYVDRWVYEHSHQRSLAGTVGSRC